MSKYAQRQPPDEERELRVALMREEVRLALWKLPHIPDEKVHIALAIGASTWQALKSCGDAPPRITIGGRIYVLTADLRAWLEARPKTTATKKAKARRENQEPDDDNAARKTEAPARPHFASALLR